MSAGWYDSNWAFRVAVSIDATGKGTSPIGVTFTVPTTFDHFWANVQSSGQDVRVTMADGQTLVSHDVNSFSSATKTGIIDLTGLAIQVSAPNFVWLYYGYASATTTSTVIAPAAAATGYFAQEQPPADRIIVVAPERVDATKPANNIQRPSGEATFVYLDVTDVLMRRRDASGGQIGIEGIQAVYLSSTTGGVSNSTTYATAAIRGKIRLIEHRGRTYVRIPLQAGSSGTNVTYEVDLWTMLNVTSTTAYDQRKLSPRFQMTIYDVSEV